MSDQNYPRSYRASDPNQRGTSGAGSDPLTELARLIGQSDPFAEFGRSDPRAREQAQDHQATDAHGWRSAEPARDDFGTQPDQDEGDRHEGDSRAYSEHDAAEAGYDTAEAGYDHDAGHDHDPAPRARGIRFFGAKADPAPGYSDPAHTGHADDGYAAEGYAEEQGYSDHAYAEEGAAADGYAPHGHGEEAVESAAAAEPEAYTDHERRDYAHVLDEDQPYPDHAAAAEEHAEDPEYGAGPPWAAKHPLAPADDASVDEPRARRRGGMLIAAAVLGLAFMGTAGAFAYRAMVVGTGTKPTPVIKASAAPVKVVPATQTADPSKTPDRVGDGGAQNERIVPHEEQPVNLQEAATPAPPRPVFPEPIAPSGAPAAGPALPPSGPGFPPPAASRTAAALPGAAGAVGATGAAAAAPGTPSEPKKVRTVTIRPEGDQGGRPAAASAPARTANAAPAASGDVAPPRAAAPSRAAPAAPAAPAAAAQGNGPLSLSPGAAAPPAAAHARAPAPAPTRTASASASSEGEGAYAVQISSQHSEAEAQASFRSLQHKYGSVLGNREPIIRKVDIPKMGTRYRAMVGGFASAQEAGQFCNSLKAAGGQCLIQRN